MTAPSFGAQLRRMRSERGLSLAQLAGLVHYSKAYLSRVETGDRAPAPGLALRCDEALGAGGELAALAPRDRPRRRGLRRPAQLPAAVPHFTGRAAELAALDRLLAQMNATGTMAVSAISGTAGIGKTALAVRWAHRVAGQFPDGQLYLNLRGFGPSAEPVTTAEAVRGFLDAFGVDPGGVPRDVDAQASLYRSILAGRRVLVVLDNARDAAQARPLLPGSPGCLTVVTSRNRLTGLVTSAGARSLTPGLLTGAEPVDLLAAVLGRGRVDGEPAAVDELARLCAGLPLALAVAAARAATGPELPLAALAAQLRDTRRRLDALECGDPATDVRAVFSWSYQHLGARAARMFRLLGVHAGPDISAPAAASLAGSSAGDAARALAALTDAHLLTEHLPGRYVLHDLLRAYAAEQAVQTDSEHGRRDGIHRVLDHYLHTAHTAVMLARPGRQPLGLSPPAAGVTPEEFTGHEQAAAWFAAEYRVLLAAVAQAAEAGFHTHAWQLPWTLAPYLRWQAHWRDWVAVQQTALTAAERLGDPHAQARTLVYLGLARVRLGLHAQGRAHLGQALALFRRLGDRANQAQVHLVLAEACTETSGGGAEALVHAQQALELYQAGGHPAARARALNAVGYCHTQLGDHRQAIACCERALALLRQFGDPAGESQTWDSLGYAHRQLGNHATAADCYQRALDLSRQLGLRDDSADVLLHMGDAHSAAGDRRAAEQSWRQALAIIEELGRPDAAQVRARLAGVDG